MNEIEKMMEVVRYVAGDFSEARSYVEGSHCGQENYMHHWPGSTCRKHRPENRGSWCWPCKAADALGRPVPELAPYYRGAWGGASRPWPGVSKQWEKEHQERIRADRVRLFGEDAARRMEATG